MTKDAGKLENQIIIMIIMNFSTSIKKIIVTKMSIFILLTDESSNYVENIVYHIRFLWLIYFYIYKEVYNSINK